VALSKRPLPLSSPLLSVPFLFRYLSLRAVGCVTSSPPIHLQSPSITLLPAALVPTPLYYYIINDSDGYLLLLGRQCYVYHALQHVCNGRLLRSCPSFLEPCKLPQASALESCKFYRWESLSGRRRAVFSWKQLFWVAGK
jgi:hypothetical protein